jgi:hypothetical protein
VLRLRSRNRLFNISSVIRRLNRYPMNNKPKKPNEIPSPGKNPETDPTPEPEPSVWPRREPEIQPGKEPLTTPPSKPMEIPPPPQ